MIIRSTWASRLSYLAKQTNRVASEMEVVNERATTGKAVNRPSDAPELTTRIMSLEREIVDQERYTEDSEYAANLQGMADQVLLDLSSVVSEARTLAVQMGSDTYEGPVRTGSAKQAEQLISQAMNLMNTTVADRHLFSGQAYKTPPYGEDFVYQGSDEVSEINVADNISVTVGFNGEEMGLGSVLEAIDSLRVALESDDASNVRATLDALTTATETISRAQTEVGVEQMTAVDFADFSSSMTLELQIQLSSFQDDDTIGSLVRLGQLETQYQATLALTAKSQMGNLFNQI